LRLYSKWQSKNMNHLNMNRQSTSMNWHIRKIHKIRCWFSAFRIYLKQLIIMRRQKKYWRNQLLRYPQELIRDIWSLLIYKKESNQSKPSKEESKLLRDVFLILLNLITQANRSKEILHKHTPVLHKCA